MGLYTNKLKEDVPVKEAKEVKKKGRPPKKVLPVEEEKVEDEQPKESESEPVKQEVQKVEETPLLPPPGEKTPPPQETVEDVLSLKKPALKKKVEKKSEKVEKKKAEPKDEEPPLWFKKFISKIGYDPEESKKVNTDIAKEAATKLWNDRVKSKSTPPTYPNYNQGQVDTATPSGYDKLYKQIFGR